MAWADIIAYTKDDLIKAKAEIDAVISAIGAKFIDHRSRNGIITDEEHYATLFKQQVLTERSLALGVAISNETDLAAVKAAVEGATYTMTQAEATDEEAVNTAVGSIVLQQALKGATFQVVKVSYTAAIAGDAGDPDGTDGVYKFKVELSIMDRIAVTSELTMTITATPQ